MNKRFEQAMLYGLIAAVIFTALAHGAVEPWSFALFELLVIFLTLLWGLQAILQRQLTLRLPRVLLPLGLWLVWGLLQSIVYTDQTGQRHSLSMDVEGTRQTTTALFTLLLALLLAAHVLARREYLAWLPLFFAGYGLALALFGLIQHFAWDGRFFWWRPTTALVTAPFGPFVAHNHFAGYMELLLPLPLAFVLLQVGRREARVFYGFAAVLMAGAAITSLSRGGFISLFVQLMFLAAATPISVAYRQPRPTPRHAPCHLLRRAPVKLVAPLLIALAMVVAIGASVYWIGMEPVIKRVAQGKIMASDAQEESFWGSRGWLWRDTLTMMRAHLVTGVGLGAFETSFPLYSQGDGSLQVGQAHNDYLQLAAETGLVGVALLLWFLGLIWSQIRRGLRSRDPLFAALALGSGGSFVGMMVHSLFDFNLQLPSHALLLVLLTAVLARVPVSEARPTRVPVRQGRPEKVFVPTVGS
jgi:O-antigen ligase